MTNKKIISLVLFMFILLSACEDSSSNSLTDDDVEEVISFTQTISGQVLLENQPEHSNALIYLAGIEKGVSSDAFGGYVIQFADSDSVYTGEVTLYYFLEDYDLDSAFIWMQDGMVKLDTMDVDSSGELPLKELKQIIRVQGWTDKVEYRRGESILVTLRFTNMSDRTLHLYMGNTNTDIGNFRLVRGGGNNTFSFFPVDRTAEDVDVLLPPGEFHEGQVNEWISEGRNILETFVPLPLTEYVVTTYFELFNRDKTMPEELGSRWRAIWLDNNEWYKLNRGPLPKYDRVPNKYELAVIRIIE